MSKLLSGPVRARSLVDVVTERLEAAIMGGELAPGSRLSEHGLAHSLGVSRGPLREAIRRLEGRKLVQRTPNIGVHIAVLSLKDLVDLLIVCEALEGMACALAAEKMTEEEIDALDRLLEAHGAQKSVRSGAGYYQEPKDFDFHFLVAKASGNYQLIQMLTGDLYDLLRVYRYRSSTLDGRALKALEEHKAIVAALRSRDPVKAEDAMREHIRHARQHAEARVDLPDGATPAKRDSTRRATA
jgi:DNA-binding GntR family transcriptional regulator